MSNQQFYADLPQELQEADELLRRYGQWSRYGYSPARCGSAEGMYRAPQDDEDRQPRMPQMPAADVDRVRAALGKLPMMTLLVIQWLYVTPHAIPAKMRQHSLHPRHMRERHLEGVAQFWANWRHLAPMTKSTIAIRSNVVENCST